MFDNINYVQGITVNSTLAGPNTVYTGFTIITPGFYRISIRLTMSLSSTGRVLVQIRRNGSILFSTIYNSLDDIVAASQSRSFSTNDIVTVTLTSTGGDFNVTLLHSYVLLDTSYENVSYISIMYN